MHPEKFLRMGPAENLCDMRTLLRCIGENAAMAYSCRTDACLFQDDLSGDDARYGVRHELTWSSVITRTTAVHVVGSGADVTEHRADDSGITWYVGYDELEVAPSSVLASHVTVAGRTLFRALVRNTADAYYLEPAFDYLEVSEVDCTCNILSLAER